MATAVIGRFWPRACYQAISEQLPLRVEFYESWLSAKGFRPRRVSTWPACAPSSASCGSEGDALTMPSCAARASSRRTGCSTTCRPCAARLAAGAAAGAARAGGLRPRQRARRGRRGTRSAVQRALAARRRHADVAPSLFCDVRDAGARARSAASTRPALARPAQARPRRRCPHRRVRRAGGDACMRRSWRRAEAGSGAGRVSSPLLVAGGARRWRPGASAAAQPPTPAVAAPRCS